MKLFLLVIFVVSFSTPVALANKFYEVQQEFGRRTTSYIRTRPSRIVRKRTFFAQAMMEHDEKQRRDTAEHSSFSSSKTSSATP
jgi:hypothetical protein